MTRSKEIAVGVVLIGLFFTAFFTLIGYALGESAGRQSVEAVACTPNVDGLWRNGREIPTTTAQRDSLAMRTR